MAENTNQYGLPDLTVEEPAVTMMSTPFDRADAQGKLSKTDYLTQLNKSIALGDVATIVEIGKELYSSKLLNNVANINIIERAKYEAAKIAQQKTGKPFIPSTAEQVVIDFNDPQEIDALSKGQETLKKNQEAAFNNIKGSGFWTEVPSEDGKSTVYISSFDKKAYGEGKQVKTYTTEEKTAVEAERIKKLGLNNNISKTKQGDTWIITMPDGQEVKTKDEAEANTYFANAKEQKDSLDAVASGIGVDLGKVDAEVDAAATEAGGEYKASLQQFAGKNGITLTEQQLSDYAKEIAAGTKTIDGVQQFLRETELVTRYPAWEDKIKQGYNITDIANPYINAMADTFELATVDGTELLKDGLIQQALSGVGADGKPTYMPLWQFQEKLKQDDRYYQTNKSHDEMATLASSIGQVFGMI